jgi:uncharacterized protein (TIGR02594 family)
LLAVGCISLMAMNTPALGDPASRDAEPTPRAARQSYAERVVAASKPVFGWPALVKEARKYIGTNPTNRSRLWCATFMNLVLANLGYPGTNSDAAKSFAFYVRRISKPAVGAIAVLTRGKRRGHVGVVNGVGANGNPVIISGNHNKRVGVGVYPRSRVIAYVMPTGRGSPRPAARQAAPTRALEARRPDGDLAAKQAELVLGRPARHIDVAAEAQWIDRRAGERLHVRDRCKIDDRKYLLRHVGKTVVAAAQHPGRPAQVHGAVMREELFDRRAPFRCPQITARGLAAFPPDGQGIAGLIKVGAQRCQPFIAHQHQEALLGEIGGLFGVEADRPVFDGVEPVGGHALARRQQSARQRLRRETLHGIAVERLDRGLVSHGSGNAAGCVNRPES